MTRQGDSVRRERGERGSALLIVLVFSAVLLIMLYREIPIAMFEAQRQKEQLTVDHGHEYQRAVQLYYRKMHQFPPTMDALLNTNGMRFLRRKYTDPLTGKDDWRLLHAGPGGMLTDSKVNPMGNVNTSGMSSQPVAQSGAQQNSQQSGSSLYGTSTLMTPADTDAGTDAGLKLRHSPPAIEANGSGAPSAGGDGTTPTTAQLDADPSKPLLPSIPDTGASGNGTEAAAQTPGASNAGANGGVPASVGPSAGQSAMSAIVANNQGNSGPQPSTPNGQAGSMVGGVGGIAGVASIAKGHGIKKVNDQDDYSRWEFYYDVSKDTGTSQAGTGAQNTPGGVPGMQPAQGQQQTGQQTGQQSNAVGFTGTQTTTTPSQ